MINDIVKDIYETIEMGNTSKYFAETLGSSIASRLYHWARPEVFRSGLRLSRLGPSCPKAFWHSVHTPELAEVPPPAARIKFAYGHVLEAIVIGLAREAGYEVMGEQDELELLGVKGHRDCIIGGCTVDIKSCSGRSFDKFKTRTIETDDAFGYLDQLDAYTVAAALSNDPLVTITDKAYIIAVHKELGHLYLYEHKVRPERIIERVNQAKQIAGETTPPPCQCGTRAEGSSGNIRLDVKASYSAYKHLCFPGLRTFLYSTGPVYLSEVRRKPDVPEVDRQGNRTFYGSKPKANVNDMSTSRNVELEQYLKV
jgi:hypothetical protein